MFDKGFKLDWGQVADLANRAAFLATEWAGVACLAVAAVFWVRRRYTYSFAPWFAIVRKAWPKFGGTSAVTWVALGLDVAFLWAEALCGIVAKPKAAKVEASEEPPTEPALEAAGRMSICETIEVAVEAREEARGARRQANEVARKLDALANVVLSPPQTAAAKTPSRA